MFIQVRRFCKWKLQYREEKYSDEIEYHQLIFVYITILYDFKFNTNSNALSLVLNQIWVNPFEIVQLANMSWWQFFISMWQVISGRRLLMLTINWNCIYWYKYLYECDTRPKWSYIFWLNVDSEFRFAFRKKKLFYFMNYEWK